MFTWVAQEGRVGTDGGRREERAVRGELWAGEDGEENAREESHRNESLRAQGYINKHKYIDIDIDTLYIYIYMYVYIGSPRWESASEAYGFVVCQVCLWMYIYIDTYTYIDI